jgi:hypothetical protein
VARQSPRASSASWPTGRANPTAASRST